MSIEVGLFFNLHFSDELVLILDLSFNLLEVFWHLSVVLFLQVIFVGACWQFRGGQDILNSVRHDEIFVRNKTHYWLLVLLWNGDFLEFHSLVFFGLKKEVSI